MPLHRRVRDTASQIPLWTLFPLFFAFVYLSHITLLRLPYFWDEAGYYIPAAWDFFRTGSLIPQSTLTNAHPPLPSILLAVWWHLSSFVVSGTRTFICLVTAAALLAVYKLARDLAGALTAATTVFLTALYPVWFTQSTLAHADIFAAAFTLWALAVYLAPSAKSSNLNPALTAALFSLAALSKETAIVTPFALAICQIVLLVQHRHDPNVRRECLRWLTALAIPIIPLAAWYAYHYHQTGFVFGNPEFLRYNATANLTPVRILFSLWHRFVHLTIHMNLFVPVLCGLAALLIPVSDPDASPAIPRSARHTIAVVLIANLVAFSILGGALLTRYLLPLYPLEMLLCVSVWRRHLPQWWAFAVLSAVGFLSALWINPPYTFAPEDNLTYRNMIVLHQQAAAIIEHRFPQATVLTAWPATSELSRPEIGYTHRPIKVFAIQNFSLDEVQKAAADPGQFDTALLFSTKCEPVPGHIDLGKLNHSADTRYYDFHSDLSPVQTAALLHGQLLWQASRNCEWVAILRFPRIVNATLIRPTLR